MITYKPQIHTRFREIFVNLWQDLPAMFIRFFIVVLLAGLCSSAFAQGFKTELETPEKVSLVIKNLDGRVSVVASEEQQKKVAVEAKSTGLALDPEDVKVEAKGSDIHIDVRPRGEKNRIDLT